MVRINRPEIYLKVRTAGREYHFVGLEEASVDGEGDVDEGLIVQELIEYRK